MDPNSHISNDDSNSEKESEKLIDTGFIFNLPAKRYENRVQMIDEIKSLGLLHNIHIRVWQHFPKRGFGEQVLRCAHSGDFRMRKKSVTPCKRAYTGTIKCQCPFRLKCVKQKDDKWEIHVLNGYHNHNLVKKARGLNARTKEDIVRMTASKISVSNILIDLGNKGISINAKQVYNVRAISKKKARFYRTSAEQMLKLAEDHGYRAFHQTIPVVTQKGTHELTDVLFAHPNSLQLLKAYPHVLIADCTYNTNKYKLPLLEVIGVTPVHKNFSVFFAFLQNERETAYDWAFNCLTELLDSNEPIVFVTDKETALINAIEKNFLSASLLLCRRHIQKDVEAWVKRNYYGNALVGEVFAKGKWTQMVRSTTLEEFKKNEELMFTTYGFIPGLEDYCKNTWLDKYKERFVSVWTNKILHFGNVTTNRVESAHAALKRLLRTSVGGFDTVFETIHQLVTLQIRKIDEDLETSLSKQLHVSLAMSVYRRLSFNVAHHAITTIDREFKKGNCNGCAIEITHGLPCKCVINRLLNTDGCIELDSIHPFWKTLRIRSRSEDSNNDTLLQEHNKLTKLVDVVLNSNAEMIKKVSEFVENLLHPINIIDPKVKKTRGRPKKTSVSRKPSYWEHIEKRFPVSKCKKRKPKVNKVTKSTTITAAATSFSVDMPDLNIPYYMPSPQETEHTSLFPYSDQIPHFMVPWINDWVNVVGDGNCGYRAVAQEIYGDENKWLTVRHDMLGELKKNRHIYIQIYGSEIEVDEMITRVSWWTSPAPSQYWMSTEMGFIIATCYDAIFTYLSSSQSVTTLPVTRKSAISERPKQIISVALLESFDHFIWVRFGNASPLPTMHPLWKFVADKSRESEFKQIETRITSYRSHWPQSGDAPPAISISSSRNI